MSHRYLHWSPTNGFHFLLHVQPSLSAMFLRTLQLTPGSYRSWTGSRSRMAKFKRLGIRKRTLAMSDFNHFQSICMGLSEQCWHNRVSLLSISSNMLHMQACKCRQCLVHSNIWVPSEHLHETFLKTGVWMTCFGSPLKGKGQGWQQHSEHVDAGPSCGDCHDVQGANSTCAASICPDVYWI